MLKNKSLWFGFGLIIIFGQSFFLIIWPALLWLIILNLIFDFPWTLILSLGLINDLLQLNPLGKTMGIFLILSLVIRTLNQVFGWSKSYQVKVTDF